MDFNNIFKLFFPWTENDQIIPRSRLAAFYQSYGSLSVLAILSANVLVSATPPTFLKGFSWSFSVIVSMTWRWSYFTEGHARLIFTRVMVLWQFFNSKSCLCNSFCSFQWILKIFSPWPEENHIYGGHTWPLLPELWSFAIITIEKPCRHNILRTAWARILIVGIWLRINVYVTWFTFEQIPWNIYWVVPPLQLCHYSNRKTLSTRYLENYLN